MKAINACVNSSKALSLLREIASSRMMRECLYATSSRKDADLVVVPLDLGSGVETLGRDDDRFLPLLLFFNK